MFPKPKIKIVSNQDDKGVLCYFKNRAEVERCVASGCKLISASNMLEESELSTAIELISLLSVEIWRLEKRIDKTKKDVGIDITIIDQIQRIKDVFKKQNIEIIEHTNTDNSDGLSVKVLHYEEIDDLPEGKERIIETVKPSIYFKGNIISNGEVIVGKAKKKRSDI